MFKATKYTKSRKRYRFISFKERYYKISYSTVNLSKLLFPSSSAWFFLKHKQQERLRGVKRSASWQERLPHKGNQQPISARSSPEGPRGNLVNHRQHLGRPVCVLGGNKFVLHQLQHFDVYFMCDHTETSSQTSSAGRGGMLNLGRVKNAIFSLQTRKRTTFSEASNTERLSNASF